jgi:glycerophosphoryl diester phosphodiesterase
MISRILFFILIPFVGMAQTFDFDLQGHRGARGLAPENTIPAFLKALEYPVTTLELDVVITADHQVVVSHEPWLNALICLDANGERIPLEKQKEFNIYTMTLDEVQQCDCGRIGNPGFPEQVMQATVKPSLAQVFQIVEAYLEQEGRAQVRYNIEIKSSTAEDGVFHPNIELFSKLVFDVIENSGVHLNRILIQSFDFRVLKLWNEVYPDYHLAALVSNRDGWVKNIEQLGFTPAVYSPYYKFLSASDVAELHQAGMLVVPWTVNTTEEMRELLEWGVDGIITDYPDRAVVLLKRD